MAPPFDAGRAQGDIRCGTAGLDRQRVHLWLANIGLMLMSMLENNVAEPDEIREMVRELVVPAFVDNGARGGDKAARRVAKRAR